MQGTRYITFDNCGRRFKFSQNELDSVSARGQNWLDVDGTVSGLGEATLIGSGLDSAKNWWGVDDEGRYLLCSPHQRRRFYLTLHDLAQLY